MAEAEAWGGGGVGGGALSTISGRGVGCARPGQRGRGLRKVPPEFLPPEREPDCGSAIPATLSAGLSS